MTTTVTKLKSTPVYNSLDYPHLHHAYTGSQPQWAAIRAVSSQAHCFDFMHAILQRWWLLVIHNYVSHFCTYIFTHVDS